MLKTKYSLVPNCRRGEGVQIGFYLRHVYVFSICLGKNNAEAIEFLGIIKTTFPRIRKYILLFKKEKKFFTQ